MHKTHLLRVALFWTTVVLFALHVAVKGDSSVLLGTRVDAVVAEDGSGQFRTIGEDIKAAPEKTVFAKDFTAYDIGFHNTAGPAMGQAVALMVAGDRGAFYRCKISGYQDTLFAHSNRQYFRDCAIYGTVDFIFGDSAAVFQNCAIRPRKPLPGQFNAITAQEWNGTRIGEWSSRI
ncbi:unnamed protein product [Cuscuta campestris]|uniref:Pectinesterase n=1 Tax=Cuscuta campestris TaxID=132261 RepID=A0A484L6L6_9ASTE|nr:unnamed protein product [Cuscuta campestris]